MHEHTHTHTPQIHSVLLSRHLTDTPAHTYNYTRTHAYLHIHTHKASQPTLRQSTLLSVCSEWLVKYHWTPLPRTPALSTPGQCLQSYHPSLPTRPNPPTHVTPSAPPPPPPPALQGLHHPGPSSHALHCSREQGLRG